MDLAGRRIIVAAQEVDAATVRRHVVRRSPVAAANRRHAQLDWQSEIGPAVAAPVDRHGAQLSLGTDEEQLGPVMTPNGLVASFIRNDDPLRGTVDAANGDLWSACFVGHVCDPTA